MKKILFFIVFIITCLIVGVAQYYSFMKKEVSINNFESFINTKYEKIQNFPEHNFYFNVVSLSNENINIKTLDNIINQAESNLILDQALLRKSEILFIKQEYSQALSNLNKIKGDIYKPFISILKGDIFSELKRNDLALSEYKFALEILNDMTYKIVVLEKIKNLKRHN